MTTGNIINDAAWIPAPHTAGFIGRYRRKTWSGGDDPVEPKAVKAPPEYITRTINGEVKRLRVMRRQLPYRKKKHTQNHPLDVTFVRTEDEEVAYVYSGTTYYANTNGFRPSLSPESLAFTPSDELNLLGKLREQVYGSDFNLAVTLGEGRQTLQMISDSAIRIAKSVRHIKRFDFTGGLRSLLEGTGREPIPSHSSQKGLVEKAYAYRRDGEEGAYRFWLECQYGWRPLLSDAKSGAQFIAHHVEVPWKQVFRVQTRKSAFLARNFDLLSDSGARYLKSEAYVYWQRKLHVVMTQSPPTLAQKLGLLDPLTVAWELLPFSFVYDWFIPIGSYLQANAFARSLNAEVWQIDKKGSFSRYTDTSDCEENPYFSVVYKRQPGSLTPPIPQWKGFGQSASWSRVIDAIALLGQNFRKK